MKTQVVEYNKSKAKWYFGLFKFLELFGVFLFILVIIYINIKEEVMP